MRYMFSEMGQTYVTLPSSEETYLLLKRSDAIHPYLKKTFAEVYQDTLKREKELKEHGLVVKSSHPYGHQAREWLEWICYHEMKNFKHQFSQRDHPFLEKKKRDSPQKMYGDNEGYGNQSSK